MGSNCKLMAVSTTGGLRNEGKPCVIVPLTMLSAFGCHRYWRGQAGRVRMPRRASGRAASGLRHNLEITIVSRIGEGLPPDPVHLHRDEAARQREILSVCLAA
jgi:hypothetical protein